MTDYVFTTRQGALILLQLRFNTRKNIIIRTQLSGRLQLSIPRRFTQNALDQWLSDHETLLEQYWQRQQQLLSTQPETIWFKGQCYPYVVSPVCVKVGWYGDRGFVLPLAMDKERPYRDLISWLQEEAQDYLLERLRYWSQQLNLRPVSMKLTTARTLWGVCRPQTGIRLNWRLVGAPLWVVDYVCIHELCHLIHLNHGAAFWQLVNRHTPHTQTARMWLKQHGSALFIPEKRW
ncbi:SprT family zinc-dependent metalloprotease [Neisseriaceae bacterium ESL0693]|nr:SprT family zinc-dependent metalloprotease [Neisseriaceae bacterium ESL0693]